MEKQDELKAFARMCVQSLSDDAELRQERETELFGHLKEAIKNGEYVPRQKQNNV